METPDGWGNGEIGKWGNAGRGAEGCGAGRKKCM